MFSVLIRRQSDIGSAEGRQLGRTPGDAHEWRDVRSRVLVVCEQNRRRGGLSRRDPVLHERLRQNHTAALPALEFGADGLMAAVA